jgi:hypothetical protein
MATNTWTSSTSGNWTTAGDWSLGVPTSSQDVSIGSSSNNTIVTSNGAVTVNSISINSGDELLVSDPTFSDFFTVTNSTGSGGIFGELSISDGLFNAVGGFMNNSGLIFMSDNATSNNVFYVSNTVTLEGAGTFVMSENGQSNIWSNQITGTNPGSTLINLDNTISGTGLIQGINFVNHGTVDTDNLLLDGTLTLWGNASGGSVDNENLLIADANGTLILGKDTDQSTIINNGSIEVKNSASGTQTFLQVAGNLTIQGGSTGQILFQGTNPNSNNIVSDGQAAVLNLVGGTMTGAGNLGDANLTVNLSGGAAINESGAGQTLVINAASTAVGATTSLTASNGGLVFLDKAVSDSGLIAAFGGGFVFVLGAVSNANDALVVAANSEIILGTGGTVSNNINFTGTGATIKLQASANQYGGEISGGIAGDTIDTAYVPFATGVHAVWRQIGNFGTLQLQGSNGNTLTSLALQGEYTSADFSAVMDSTGGTNIQIINTQVTKTDVNNDGTSDAILQNGGTVVDWIMQNGLYSTGNVLTTGATGFSVVGSADFNGDGTADALLQNGGTVVDWILKNGQYQSGNVLTSAATGFSVVGTGDFNGDGTGDVLLQNGGTVVDWIMQNGQYQSGNVLTSAATGFTVVGAGDFNGDGTSDVLLQNGGTVVDWIMQNGQYQSGNVLTTAATGFKVVGTGDFNADGTSDVLLQNGGTVVDWIMKNGAYQSGNVLTMAATGFSVVGTGDYNGDGTNDVLLQNGGTVVDWIMKNGAYQSGNVITTGATGFSVSPS